jgi:hypothetical protein
MCCRKEDSAAVVGRVKNSVHIQLLFSNPEDTKNLNCGLAMRRRSADLAFHHPIEGKGLQSLPWLHSTG